jgi:hypothetical protein
VIHGGKHSSERIASPPDDVYSFEVYDQSPKGLQFEKIKKPSNENL